MADTSLVIHYSKLRYLLAVFFLSAASYVFDKTYSHYYPKLFYWVGGIILLFGFATYIALTYYSNREWNKLEQTEKTKSQVRQLLSDIFLYIYFLIIIGYLGLAYYAHHNPYENSTTGNTIRRERTTITNTTKTITDTLKEVTQSGQDNK